MHDHAGCNAIWRGSIRHIHTSYMGGYQHEKKEMLWHKKQQAVQADDARSEVSGAPHGSNGKGRLQNVLL